MTIHYKTAALPQGQRYAAPHHILKTIKTPQGLYFKGYASVFNVADRQGDRVLRGAFRRCLHPTQAHLQKIKILWQHQATQPIGIVHRLQEDSYGLLLEAEIITRTRFGKDVAALLQAGAVDSLSIGYTVVKAKPDPVTRQRLLEEVMLWEISLVTFPANPAATITSIHSTI